MDFISLALSTFCIAVIFTIVPIVYRQYVIRRKLKNFPQSGGYPFIGIALEVMNMSEFERMKWFLSFAEKFEEQIFVHWVGSMPLIHIYKPEHLELIFPSTVNITKGIPYGLLGPWLGNGLLTSTGEQWFHDRKLIGPTFHFSILDQFAVVLSEKAEILTKCLEKEIEKDLRKAIDIFPFISNATLDIICETAMGVNIRAQETVTEYISTIHAVTLAIVDRVLRPWYQFDWLYYSLPEGKRFKSMIDTLHKFTRQVIKKKKAERQSRKGDTELENGDDEFNIGKRKRKAFLDLLLDQNEKDDTPLTDEELRAQVDTFMFEGHDTTAAAITWALFLLGNNLEHQEKVHEELEKVFKDSKTPATVKELSQLKYLERVIKETLRLLPSVPVISRKLTENVKIDNYILPKGETVVLAIGLAHLNSKVWPNPYKFDPDRFLPENSKHRHPYAYIPFSAGPRNCIGQKFALLEEIIVLTAILRKWRVKSVKTFDTIEYGGSIVLRPHEKVLIHFMPKI